MIKLINYEDYGKGKPCEMYLNKSCIKSMFRDKEQNITWICCDTARLVTFYVKETPEEILAMSDIETKVIDWEQRRFEAAMLFAAHQWMFESPKPTAVQAVEFADALIDVLKKGQDNED